MKIVQQTTHIDLGLYHLLTVGQVYSHDRTAGTRVETRFYMRTDKGMVCLDNGAFLPAEAFTANGGAYTNWGFKPHPTAHLSV